MKILMMTNTYTPHVGGVAHSVERFTQHLRQLGHRVVVIAPEFENMPEDEIDVIRIPAIQNFNNSDFSVVLPVPGYLHADLEDLQPDIVHSHHPFLMGTTALRVANQYHSPLVFTHHTMYEQYTHYVPGDSPALKRFTVKLTTGYANMCDQVIAPSQSIADILRKRGVKSPIESIPTGVDIDRFKKGDGNSIRKDKIIPPDAFVIGHVGRLAPEKNLDFLTRAVSETLEKNPEAHFLVVGDGPSLENMKKILEKKAVSNRAHFTGSLEGEELVNAYHAMDVFAFASKSETQGMVLVEAFAAGVPVAALDAPGAREVVRDKKNGRLFMNEETSELAGCLEWVIHLSPEDFQQLREESLKTASEFSTRACAEHLLDIYDHWLKKESLERPIDESFWRSMLEQIRLEWDIIANYAEAAGDAASNGSKAGEVT
jgi:glycosyltransferase involved in cell wall biosynthesis